jgi:hypothetical protein
VIDFPGRPGEKGGAVRGTAEDSDLARAQRTQRISRTVILTLPHTDHPTRRRKAQPHIVTDGLIARFSWALADRAKRGSSVARREAPAKRIGSCTVNAKRAEALKETP